MARKPKNGRGDGTRDKPIDLAKWPRQMRSGFLRKLATLPHGQCTCWDCLRGIGLTPPKYMRDKHQRLAPAVVMREEIDRFGRLRFIGRKAEREEDKSAPVKQATTADPDVDPRLKSGMQQRVV